MTVEYGEAIKSGVTINACRISIGTVFCADEGNVLLRTYNNVVDLENPRRTWDVEDSNFDNYRVIHAKVVIEK